MSRWMTFLECRYVSALANWLMYYKQWTINQASLSLSRHMASYSRKWFHSVFIGVRKLMLQCAYLPLFLSSSLYFMGIEFIRLQIWSNPISFLQTLFESLIFVFVNRPWHNTFNGANCTRISPLHMLVHQIVSFSSASCIKYLLVRIPVLNRPSPYHRNIRIISWCLGAWEQINTDHSWVF